MKNIFLALVGLWFVTACDSYDTISDRDMENILSEALLTNAIAVREAGYAEAGSQGDSIDYYAPILDKYDYTLEDFRGTIREMATRKSNPLAEIFTRVNRNLDSLAAAAEYRYNISLRYDSIALAHYADTLYDKDTLVRGSLAKLRIAVSKPQAGAYSLSFAYRSTEDYRVGSKSVTFQTQKTGTPDQRFWIDRVTRDTAQFKGVFNLDKSADTLVVNFQEPTLSKKDAKLARDTSFVQHVRLVYAPAVEKVRRDYMNQLLHLTDFLSFTPSHEKDSLPIPFRR